MWGEIIQKTCMVERRGREEDMSLGKKEEMARERANSAIREALSATWP